MSKEGKFSRPYRVENGRKFRLKDVDPGDTAGLKADKEKAGQVLAGGVKMLAVSTLGVLYMVEKGGETVTDIKSLAGKTIYATGKGATVQPALPASARARL